MIKRITQWLRTIFSNSQELEIYSEPVTVQEVAPVVEEVVMETPTQPEPQAKEVAPIVEEVAKPHKPRRRNNRRKKKPTQEAQPVAETPAIQHKQKKGRGRPKNNK